MPSGNGDLVSRSPRPVNARSHSRGKSNSGPGVARNVSGFRGRLSPNDPPSPREPRKAPRGFWLGTPLGRCWWWTITRASGEASRPTPRRPAGSHGKPREVSGWVRVLGVVGGERMRGLPETPLAQLPAVPPARAGGLLWGLAPSEARCLHPLPTRTQVEYGFARGGPVPIEPALGNRSVADQSASRIGARGEARSPTSERRAWMPEASVRRDGTGSPRASARYCGGSFGQAFWALLVMSEYADFRRRLSPNGPPSPRLAPGGFYGTPFSNSRMRADDGLARGSPCQSSGRNIWPRGGGFGILRLPRPASSAPEPMPTR
jgi:hypothetical protein